MMRQIRKGENTNQVNKHYNTWLVLGLLGSTRIIRDRPTLDLLEDGVVELRKVLRVWLQRWVVMVDTRPQPCARESQRSPETMCVHATNPRGVRPEAICANVV